MRFFAFTAHTMAIVSCMIINCLPVFAHNYAIIRYVRDFVQKHYCTAIHVPISLQLSILLNLSAVPLPLIVFNAYPFSEM